MSDNKEKYGVIHEIGDMGFGFDVVSDEDQEKIEKENK